MRSDASLAASIACLLYLRSVSNDFVFDDRPAIQNNPCLEPGSSFASLLTTDFWGTPLEDPRSHHSYRPLAVLSLRFNVVVAGRGDAAHFHAVNVAIHAANTWLLWLLARKSLASRSEALVAALLFAAHPVNSEAVAYAVGRADLLGAMFGLAATMLYAQARSIEHHQRAPRALLSQLAAGLCMAMALMCKETAVVLMPAFVLGDGIRLLAPSPLPSRKGPFIRRLLPGWLLLASLCTGFAALRTYYVGPIANRFRRLDNPIPFLPTALDRALACARVHLLCASLLVWPAKLSADYS
jgi:hypothetical protein